VASIVNVFISDVREGRRGAGDSAPLPVVSNPIIKSILTMERKGWIERCFGWGVERRHPPPILNSSGWKVTAMDTASAFDPPAYCTDQKGARASKGEPKNRHAAPVLPPPSTDVISKVSATCPKSKPGLTAFVPGSRVVFNLPVMPADAAAWPGTLDFRDQKRKVVSLVVTFLSSYDGMGVSSLECVHGCMCDAKLLDGHQHTKTSSNLAFQSVGKVEKLSALVDASSESCAVRFTLLPKSYSGGTKFKLLGLALRWRHPIDIQSKKHKAF
jgi:hypothetical protein